MMRAVLTWVTIGWAALVLSSVVSMMAVFLGSRSQDLAALLALQAYLLPAALIAIGLYLRFAGRAAHDAGAFGQLWDHTPGWLVFVVTCAASLTLIAELSLLLLDFHEVASRSWLEHVPALGALVYAVALAMGYASLRIGAAK